MNKKTRGKKKRKKIIFLYVVWMWRERERERERVLPSTCSVCRRKKKKPFDHYTLMDILIFFFFQVWFVKENE